MIHLHPMVPHLFPKSRTDGPAAVPTAVLELDDDGSTTIELDNYKVNRCAAKLFQSIFILEKIVMLNDSELATPTKPIMQNNPRLAKPM